MSMVKIVWLAVLWLFAAFVLMLHIVLPILNAPQDHIFVFNEDYRGISMLALVYTGIWIILYLLYRQFKNREQYRKDKKEQA